MELTRRNFLRFGAAGATVAGISALAGCSPKAEETTEQSADTNGDDWLGEAPALTPDDCSQTVECEVLVVGSALAGSMAAYGALKNGAKVTVIERNCCPHIGGMTISVFNSKMQKDAGLPMYDEVEIANKMYKNCQYRGDMTLYTAWINRSGEIFDQLKEDFIDPYEQYCVPVSLEGIFPDPTQEVSEYISTGIAFDETDILTEFTHKFHQFLEDQGVETHYDTCAQSLVKDDSGRVVGLIATNKDGENVYYSASKGVVMCTGSFGSNEKMMKHFYPSHYAKWALENNSYWAYMGDDPVSVQECDDGLGHRMLCWAGAEMEEICGWASWQTTGWRSFPYLMVNTKGKRFMNE
ncbi:MAG: FAD-dependent oxidoreductase, partial [Alistipes finegoldii]|nr:FAD-dependent oxidoreductase [Alistipes finegoldii]